MSEIAELTINGADEMTWSERREIAAWLRREARNIEKNGPLYASTYIARRMAADGAGGVLADKT